MSAVTDGRTRAARSGWTGPLPFGQIGQLLAFLGVAVVMAFLAQELRALDQRALFMGCTVIASLAAWATVRQRAEGIWSVQAMYAGVFWIFHFGLILSIAVDATIPEEIELSMRRYWPTEGAVNHAAVLAAAGLAAYAAGAIGAGLLPAPTGRLMRPLTGGEERAVSIAALLLVAGSIVAWLLLVTSVGGPSLLVASYRAFLDQTHDLGLSYLYFYMGLGVVFAATVSPSPVQLASFLLFGGFAAIALPLGLRGEVLFPACTALALSADRLRGLSLRKVAVLVLLLLSTISFIREGRRLGLARMTEAASAFQPLGGSAELGGTIWPVAEVVSWADGGEDYMLGATYWAPIDRALYYVVPGWTRLPAEEDPRIMNVVIARRVSAIGFSPIAEAHRNFGDFGVVGFMLLLGAVMGRLSGYATTRRGGLLAGVIMFPLLICVRNSFTPVPVQLALGSALMAVALRLARRRPRSPTATLG